MRLVQLVCFKLNFPASSPYYKVGNYRSGGRHTFQQQPSAHHMKCPDCGSKTQILESRQRKRIANANDLALPQQVPLSFVVTNAQPKLKNRFSTYEVDQRDYQKMLLLVDAAQKTEKALKSANADLTALIRTFAHI